MPSAIRDVLGQIQDGHLVLDTPEGEQAFGIPGSGLAARIRVTDNALYSRVLSQGSIGLGEAFMDGQWDATDEDVISLLGILSTNDLMGAIWGNPLLLLRLLVRKFATSPTDKTKSKNNIAHHYDLGNNFYELMLDESMTYSCGYRAKATDTIDQMQKRKYALIADKLELRSGQTLIDIGCGWGGMLRHAVKHGGVARGTGVTLSKEQAAYAKERNARESLGDTIDVRLQDYRDVTEQFDRFVSIGMFEHVGLRNERTFMQKTNAMLKPGGIGLLHTIGTLSRLRSPFDAWMDRYIFPGARLPRLEELARTMRQAGLTIVHVENLKLHYAETLMRWRENVLKNWKTIRTLGTQYDDRFLRMWRYYLDLCESSFRHGNVQLYQLVFYKGHTWTPRECLRYAPPEA